MSACSYMFLLQKSCIDRVSLWVYLNYLELSTKDKFNSRVNKFKRAVTCPYVSTQDFTQLNPWPRRCFWDRTAILSIYIFIEAQDCEEVLVTLLLWRCVMYCWGDIHLEKKRLRKKKRKKNTERETKLKRYNLVTTTSHVFVRNQKRT